MTYQPLRIDYETLRGINPQIICCSISGFGHTVPDPDRPAFDLILQALGGIMSVIGEPGRPPVKIGIPIGDLAGERLGFTEEEMDRLTEEGVI